MLKLVVMTSSNSHEYMEDVIQNNYRLEILYPPSNDLYGGNLLTHFSTLFSVHIIKVSYYWKDGA